MLQEIERSILANVPVLYVVTPEERLFTGKLEAFCVRKRRRLWVYKVSTGLVRITFSGTGEFWFESQEGRVHEELKDPIALLEHLKRVRCNDGLFLLLDFHEFLRDPVVRRLLKDVAERFKASRNNVIILSPVLELPRSLMHAVSVTEFPLPAREELAQALEAILKTLKGRRVAVGLDKGERERLVAAGRGMTMAQFEDCLARAAVTCSGTVDARFIDEMIRGKKRFIRQEGLLEFFDTADTMAQVGGLEQLKAWLAKRRDAYGAEAEAFGLPPPKGILLLGVQGCGKSLTAKACASLWQFPLLRLDTGALFSGQVGSSEESTRRAIRLAEAVSPCVLWIDEIEKAMAGVGSSSFSDAGTAARVFASLATWLQEKSAPVFVIATANSVTSLPPELIRKGRWDEIFFLDLPGLGERKTIFSIHLARRKRDPRDFDIDQLARSCPDYSGAEIEQAVIGGLYDAFDQRRPLTTEDILKNLEEQVPLSTTMAEQIQALRAWAATRARAASADRLEKEQQKWRSGNVRHL
jgi:AAA+ superfamily predicted ATPase